MTNKIPELSKILGIPVVGKVADIWLGLSNLSATKEHDYRVALCERKGVDLDAMLKQFPPTGRVVQQHIVSGRTNCRHRGERIRTQLCPSCKGNVDVIVFGCKKHGECSIRSLLPDVKGCENCHDAESPLRYIRTEELVASARKMTQHVPSYVNAIAGAPRSGMIPAAAIATQLHLPLYSISPSGVLQKLHGGGRSGSLQGNRFLVVEDTVYSGNRMRSMKNNSKGLDAVWSTVYCNPNAAGVCDLIGETLPSPHLLEWNLFNSGVINGRAINKRVMLAGVMSDLDGVICEDCQVDDRDEAAYIDWMKNAKPLNLPRMTPIPVIVTFRIEKYRQITVEWLHKWGVRYNQLIMHPATSNAERHFNVIKHKAEIFKNSNYGLFIESNELQAKAIAAHSCKPVVCIDTGKVYQ